MEPKQETGGTVPAVFLYSRKNLMDSDQSPAGWGVGSPLGV